MFIKQLSVFMENVSRRLEDISSVLGTQNINIISLSIADTNEFGIARFIVSNPEKARELLKDAGFSCKLSDVLAIAIENKPGKLQETLKYIGESGANIDYLYVLSNSPSSSSMIIKVDDETKIEPYVSNKNLKILDGATVYSLQ